MEVRMLGHPSPRGAAIAGALLGLLALAWIPGAAVARKSYSAESYRTDIRLQEDEVPSQGVEIG